MTAIILAGGRSKRLGQDKTALEICGESLIERVIGTVAPLSSEVLLVLRPGQESPPLPHQYQVRTVVDLYPNRGSLGGLYSGLVAAHSFYSLVIACDMPFLSLPLLRYMIRLSPDFDIVIPRVKGYLEPLHAIYSKNCLDPIKGLLERGDLKIIDFFDTVRVKYVEEEEVDEFDPEHLSFFNINTEGDLAEAKRLIAQGET